MSEIKRYDVYDAWNSSKGGFELERRGDLEGEFVLYSDHAAEVERLEERLALFTKGMPDPLTLQEAIIQVEEAIAGGYEEDFVDSWLVAGWLRNIAAAKVGEA